MDNNEIGKRQECQVFERIDVVAYSGYKANERPLYFVLNHQKREVKEILERWYGQNHDYFKVLSDNGSVYLLKWLRFSDKGFVKKCEKRG